VELRVRFGRIARQRQDNPLKRKGLQQGSAEKRT
jgi:hypothetical protein